MNTANILPQNITSAHEMINTLVAKLATSETTLIVTKTELDITKVELSTTVTKLSEKESELKILKSQLELLRAKRFGRSSEKLKHNIEQLELFIEETEIAIGPESDDESDVIKDQSNKRQPKRLKIPDHLPREEVLHQAPSVCPSCGGNKFRKISDDISEIIEHIPASIKVVRHVRPRCACINCEKIVQATPASNPIDKGKAGPGLLAHILVQKYCNHLPLYRQSEMYERDGIIIPRSTMSSWAHQCAKLLWPLIEELRNTIFASSALHGDDTPVKVLAPGLGKTKVGRIWVYVRNGQGHGDNTPPAVCYYYTPDRKGERPREHLKNFKGILHADAYSGYNGVYAQGITEAACWAHSRRKFYEITTTSDNANIASATLEEIGKLYKVEEEIRGLNPDKRKEYRQLHAKSIVERLFAKFKSSLSKLPKHSLTAQAIKYALNNEEALKRYLDNGKIEIDNNIAERSIRGIAIGRKNWLFAGSDKGGETAAAMYTLIETAKLNNVNPWKYMHRVLSTIQDHNSKKLAELLPWNIKFEN